MRLTKARNVLGELINNKAEQAVSKTRIRFAIKTVSSEYDIIEKIINNIKVIVTVNDVEGEMASVEKFVDNFNKELSEIN